MGDAAAQGKDVNTPSVSQWGLRRLETELRRATPSLEKSTNTFNCEVIFFL